MAFLSKVGGLLKQSVSRHVGSRLSLSSSPSIFQSMRWISQDSQNPSPKVFVAGLSYDMDQSSLSDAFAHYGTVLDARIIQDRETGRSKGYGFVTYTSVEEASSAIQAMAGKDLCGRTVHVAFATERARPQYDGYSGGGGYGGGGYGGGAYGGAGGYNGGGGGYGEGYGGEGGAGGSANFGASNPGGYNGGGGGYGGGYGGEGGAGGSANFGASNPGGYNAGGYGNTGGYNAGGYGNTDGYNAGGYGNGGGNNPGGYGGGNNPGSYGGGNGGSYNDGANFDVSGGVGNVASASNFASNGGFEAGSGGGNDQFGTTLNTTNVERGAANFTPNEPVERDDRDDEELKEYANRGQ